MIKRISQSILLGSLFWLASSSVINACPIGDGSAQFKPVKTPKAFIQNSEGAHPFSLIEPTNYAIKNNGQIVVIDSEAGQIKVLTAQGKELEYFATQGSLPGELLNAKGLALDDKNGIYIADTGNHRIQRFDSQGRLIKAWGQWGHGDNQLNSPTGIAVDQQFVYVSDTGNNRIVVFNKNGQFIRSFGSYGSAASQFNQPIGLTTDGYGNLYIADSQNNQIKKYSRNGKFYKAWGARGHLPGQLATPYGISINQGLLYIAELGNHRIQVFKENGEYFRPFTQANLQQKDKTRGVNPADIRVHYPASFAASANGLYTVACEPQAIMCSAYNGAKMLARTVMEDSTRWDLGPSRYHYNSSIAVAGNTVAVLDAEAHSVSLFQRNKKDNSVALVSQLGGFGTQAGLFKSPSSIAISRSGDVLAVSDAHNHRIQLFQLSKNKKGHLAGATFKLAVGEFGREYSQFNTPTKIQFDAEDNLYILDSKNLRMQIFNKEFIFSQSYPLPQENNALIPAIDFALVYNNKTIFINPSSKTLTIVDKNNNSEQKLGERSVKNRKRQKQEDRFTSPSHSAVDKNNNIYVTDQAAQNIKKFNEKGEYVASFGQWGSGELEFYKPKSLTIDEGIIYVVDYGNYRVQMLSLEGQYQGQFNIGKRL